MDIEAIRKIKCMTVEALFSDPGFSEILVLKGGSAMDIGYNMSSRASIDLDFSIPDGLLQGESTLEELESKISGCLNLRLDKEGLVAFDVCLRERPKTVSPGMEGMWGGYLLEFKVIEKEVAQSFENIDDQRRRALILGPKNKKKFKIDISKFEYCELRRAQELDGVTIYLYPPEMLVFEKLRAICQQLPAYGEDVPNPSRSARARDFYDLHALLTNFRMDWFSPANIETLKQIFAAKRVRLSLIGQILTSREQHRDDFQSLKATVMPGETIMEYDEYFDFVIRELVEPLKALWIE